MVCHGLTTTPRTPFLNLGYESRTYRKFVFHQKKYGGKIFSGSYKPLKVAKSLWFRFCWLIFFVALRSHQQPMHGCNLESSLLSNFFIGKDFIVQMFRKWHKTCPLIKRWLRVFCFVLGKVYIQQQWKALQCITTCAIGSNNSDIAPTDWVLLHFSFLTIFFIQCLWQIIQPLCSICIAHDIITPKLLGTWNFQTLFTTPFVSCVLW